MRSSIACARCRRSKVKCVNNGVNTTCRACETTGRECTYPSPVSSGSNGAARRDVSLTGNTSANVAGDSAIAGETSRRPRLRKSLISTPTNTLSHKESPRALVDALDSNLLTPKVWVELFDIFQLHFSTDLPFLHPPTFLKPLRQSSHQQPLTLGFEMPENERSNASPQPPLPPVLLLAFLALTSRFHPQLVARHSPPSSHRPSNPLVAAEYYASAAQALLAGNQGDNFFETPDMERTQAVLMLALHHWGMCAGSKAWIYVGAAVRSAQLLGLQYERDLDDEPLARSLALTSEANHMGISPKRRKSSLNKGDAFIEQEIRRRTFWSCFIMDRYLSSGKYRPQMLQVKDLRIQLPSSERAFLFGEKVRTHLLGEELDGVDSRAEVQSKRYASVMLGTANGDGHPPLSDGPTPVISGGYSGSNTREGDENGRWEVDADEGVVSRFIKVVELYGRMVKWSCGGGRRRERHPPWDERSTFYTLQRHVSALKDSLPRDLTLTSANISAHIASRTSTPYILLHTVLSLCHIVLHREYVPFIPLQCSGPQGPLDLPIIHPEEHQVPVGFWKDSARRLFKSARDLIDLLQTCQEWGVLVETPIVGFAIYTVAFVGVYAINFPWMDCEGSMCTRKVANGPTNAETTNYTSDGRGAEAARKALVMIGHMRWRLKMADGWFRTIRRCHTYFVRMKKDFRKNTQALAASSGSDLGSSPESQRQLSLREGGAGGGLEEYRLLERTLKEFGSLEDEDLEMIDAPDSGNARTSHSADDASDAGSAAVKSEGIELQEGTPDSANLRPEGWNAINSVQTTPANNGAHVAFQQGIAAPANPASQPAQFQPGSLQQQLYASAHSTPTISPATQSMSSVATPYTQSVAQQQYPQHSYNTSASTNHTIQDPPHAAPLGSTQHHQLHAPAPTTAAAAPWTPDMKENWLNSLDTRLGGDDVAAFVEGSSWEDWAGMAAGTQGVGGWLSAVWGGAGGM